MSEPYYFDGMSEDERKAAVANIDRALAQVNASMPRREQPIWIGYLDLWNATFDKAYAEVKKTGADYHAAELMAAEVADAKILEQPEGREWIYSENAPFGVRLGVGSRF